MSARKKAAHTAKAAGSPTTVDATRIAMDESLPFTPSCLKLAKKIKKAAEGPTMSANASRDLYAMAAFYDTMKDEPDATQDAAMNWLWARFKADRAARAGAA